MSRGQWMHDPRSADDSGCAATTQQRRVGGLATATGHSDALIDTHRSRSMAASASDSSMRAGRFFTAPFGIHCTTLSMLSVWHNVPYSSMQTAMLSPTEAEVDVEVCVCARAAPACVL